VIERYRALATFGTIGIEIALSILIGLFAGRWLDGKLGTHYLALVGFFIGVIAAGRALWRALQVAQKVAAKEEEAERRAGRE
jgi:F0F1-type ATP synthase assembly protein I